MKNLIIIGAFGSLGKGISNVLLEKDYDKKYLVDFKISSEFKDKPGFTFIECGDLAVEENVKSVFDRINPGAEETFFCYSTVGGYTGGKSVMETDYAEWQKMFRMNADASFLIAKYFFKLASANKGGSILFTASATGLNAEANKSAYGASKAALINLVKTLSLEGKKYKIAANAIAPYILDTPENRSWVKDETKMTRLEDIAETAHFVFTNYESFTGNIISMNGRL